MKFGLFGIDYDGFDWDLHNSYKISLRMPIKTVEKLFTHNLFVGVDKSNTTNEERFVAIGEVELKLIFTVFTFRNKESKLLIRVISCRYVHTNSTERDVYEEAKKLFENK